jgi:hypothetical protein
MDFEEGIKEDARDMGRMADAFELIARTVESWYNLEKKRFDLEHPTKPEPRDAKVTKIPSELDRLREAQGATGESDEEWGTLGTREREFLKRSKNAASSGKAGREPETGGSESD